MNNLYILFIVINSSEEKKIKNIIKRYKIGFRFIMHGKGTASSSVLDYFGLNEEEKMIITLILPELYCKYVLKELINKLNFSEHGMGIAFGIPLSSGTKYMLDFYKNEELEDIDMEEVNQHLIVSIVNQGNAEKVMLEAKKGGAMGGTTISGLGMETEKAIKFLNITIEPEKDIVLILVPDKIKNNVMKLIIDNCGLKTNGAGICFSLPVDYVAGIHEPIND